jgi:hypothetical protein
MRIGLAVMGAAVILMAADEQRDKLIGKWANSDGGDTWAIETVGDSMRISHSVKQKTDAIECNVMGKDCEVKVGGHKAKVAMWFNGDALVEMETRGTEVTKRRFLVEGDDSLKMETIPIVPPGKTETAAFKRQNVTAAK